MIKVTREGLVFIEFAGDIAVGSCAIKDDEKDTETPMLGFYSLAITLPIGAKVPKGSTRDLPDLGLVFTGPKSIDVVIRGLKRVKAEMVKKGKKKK